MSRRKGEITPATIDRMYPHQVALLADLSKGKLGAEQDAFCHGKRLLRCERFHFVFHDDTHYIIHCFATKAHADAFMAQFGGEPFDPKERGKGVNWNKWLKGTSNK